MTPISSGGKSHLAPSTRTLHIAGGAAGDHTVTGMELGRDRLISVGTDGGADLTDEFTFTADNTINNTGGTDTTGAELVVVWAEAHPRGGQFRDRA